MRDFNRPVHSMYKVRPVEVVVSQYLIAHSEKKSKDIGSSWTLLMLETSGWIAEPAMAAPDYSLDPDVCVTIQLSTI